VHFLNLDNRIRESGVIMPAPRVSLLVADIGGTNARLGIAQWNSASATVAISAIHSLRCADFRDIAELLQAYLHALPPAPIARPRAACLAIAGPLRNNSGTLTNIGWRVDGDELARRLELDHVQLLNDFGALAASVPYLADAEVFRIRANPDANGPISVVGAGTGFGAALLVPRGGGWDLVATEGGHVSFAPTSRREQQVWEFLRGYEQHVCVEHVLSGSGIVNIHRALGGAEALGPDQISQLALAGSDARCCETIEIFCEVFGSVAGNVALTQGARGGIFLGGGILPKLLPLFDEQQFLARFDAKGIMADYVKALPVAVVTAEYPALTGAAMWYWAREL
jgi:glucokinase